jgi:choline dehydrogenase-like flavoprotein
VLQAAGVAVKCASEGVGHNLQDHLQLRMVYAMSLFL